MARLHLIPLLTATIGVVGFLPVSIAQSAAAPATSPILAPNRVETSPPASTSSSSSSASTSRRNRPISGDVAAALAAASPKYTPPPPKPEPTPIEEQPDLREIDKPKNGIVRLPKYIVQEPKPPVFTERSIHTEKGLTDIAMRRYITDADRALNRFTLPLFGSSKEARAMAMYAEDERLRNMAELEDAALTASKSDAAAGTYIRKEAQKTYLRSNDFGWTSGPPK